MSSKKVQWGPEWLWDAENRRWYMEGRDRRGRIIDYQYHYPPEPEDQVPRQNDDITEELAGMNLGGEGEPEGEPEVLGTSYDEPGYVLGTTSGAQGRSSKSKGKDVDYSEPHSQPSGSGSRSKHRHKSKSKSHQEEQDPFYQIQDAEEEGETPHGHFPDGQPPYEDDEELAAGAAAADSSSRHGYDQGFGGAEHGDATDLGTAEGYDEHGEPFESTQGHRAQRGVHWGGLDENTVPAEQEYDDPDEDPEYLAAMAESRRTTLRSSRPGQSSSEPEPFGEEFDDGPFVPDAAETGHLGDFDETGYGHLVDETEETGVEEQSTLQGGPGPFVPDIVGTEGDSEALDPRYQVHASHYFQPGMVFKVLWSEPAGQTRNNYTERRSFINHLGERFHVGFRRFIVIGNDQGHCTCVPILTYGEKACLKPGVKPKKHGIVYQHGHKPRMLPNEPQLGYRPVRMIVTAGGEKLSKESRVNYSKLVTIEHNVKVFFVGYIHEKDYQIAQNAVNDCWMAKTFRSNKRH